MTGFKQRVKSDLTLRIEASRDSASLVTRCTECDWSVETTAAEGRQLALEHRKAKHPQLAEVYRRRPPAKAKPVTPPKPAPARPARSVVAPVRKKKAKPAPRPRREARAAAPPRPREPAPPRPILLTSGRLEVARVAYEAGYTLREIGDAAYGPWGLRSSESCRELVRLRLPSLGVKMRPRGARAPSRALHPDVLRILIREAL